MSRLCFSNFVIRGAIHCASEVSRRKKTTVSNEHWLICERTGKMVAKVRRHGHRWLGTSGTALRENPLVTTSAKYTASSG